MTAETPRSTNEENRLATTTSDETRINTNANTLNTNTGDKGGVKSSSIEDSPQPREVKPFILKGSQSTTQLHKQQPQVKPSQHRYNSSSKNTPNLDFAATATSLDWKNRSTTIPTLALQKSSMNPGTTGENKLMNNSKGFSLTTSRFFGSTTLSNPSMMLRGQDAPSVSTLRFSSSTVSFTKADRFSSPKSQYIDVAQFELPSLLKTQHATGLGFGEKKLLPSHVIRNAQVNPSPAKYAQHSQPGSEAVSRSFGIPFKYYRKTYVPNTQLKEPEACMEIPGVGSYEIMKSAGMDKVTYSLTGKGKQMDELFPSCSPPCNLYSPTTRIVSPSRFSKISLGFGKKFDFTTANKRVSPGPGAYILPSAFDKFKKASFRKTYTTME